jgi:hypothetical protein
MCRTPLCSPWRAEAASLLLDQTQVPPPFLNTIGTVPLSWTVPVSVERTGKYTQSCKLNSNAETIG